ncbi:hypothetical protein HD806DRAFT_251775 [Xylariaceae sp. AK1471]|nr:hypothetical protein HD806DRAFT_251775 [Xylariaceae sp. AK1471]
MSISFRRLSERINISQEIAQHNLGLHPWAVVASGPCCCTEDIYTTIGSVYSIIAYRVAYYGSGMHASPILTYVRPFFIPCKGKKYSRKILSSFFVREPRARTKSRCSRIYQVWMCRWCFGVVTAPSRIREPKDVFVGPRGNSGSNHVTPQKQKISSTRCRAGACLSSSSIWMGITISHLQPDSIRKLTGTTVRNGSPEHIPLQPIIRVSSGRPMSIAPQQH